MLKNEMPEEEKRLEPHVCVLIDLSPSFLVANFR